MRVTPTFPMPSHDLEFFKVMETSIDYLDLAESVTSMPVKVVANTLVENVKRTSSLCQSIQDLVYWSFYFGQFEYLTLTEIQRLESESGTPMTTEAQNSFYHDAILRMFTELVEHINSSQEMRDREGDIAEEKTVQVFHMIAGQARKTVTALETMLWSMTVSYWTAFETLASDLWVAVLDGGPNVLARNAASIGKSGAQPDVLTPGDTGRLKFVQELIENGVELPYGMILKHSGRFSFMNVQSIDAAYKAVFKDDFAAVISKEDWSKLHVLEALRHLIVHNAGIVDKMFIKRYKQAPEPVSHFGFCDLPEGSSIPITGPMVKDFHELLTTSAARLITFADSKLVTT